MNNNYLKHRAYTFLLREGINSLPIDCWSILSRRNYAIEAYYKIPPVGESPEILIRKFGNAFVSPGSIPINAPYVIGINTYCSRVEQHWAALHELSHIELGHVIDLMSASGYDESKKVLEDEAKALSLYLACPDVILEHIGAYSASEIYKICNVPYNIALEKAQYFRSIGYKISAMKPENPLEKRLVYFYHDFIVKYNSTKIQSTHLEFSDELSF